MIKKTTLGLLGVLLGLALALQLRWHSSGIAPPNSRLAELPAAGPEWQSRDLPIEATEVGVNQVAAILRYDDLVYREYQSQRGSFSVYALYWGPDRIPTQIVASHTPDRCWSSAGWHCLKQDYDALVQSIGIKIAGGQGRLFRDDGGQEQHVVYWHIVGNELYDYGRRNNRMPSIWRWWRDVARWVLRTPPDQYFIRLSCDRDFAALRDDPAFNAVLLGLCRVGLKDELQSSPNRDNG